MYVNGAPVGSAGRGRPPVEREEAGSIPVAGATVRWGMAKQVRPHALNVETGGSSPSPPASFSPGSSLTVGARPLKPRIEVQVLGPEPCERSSAGRAPACHVGDHGFEPRRSLHPRAGARGWLGSRLQNGPTWDRSPPSPPMDSAEVAQSVERRAEDAGRRPFDSVPRRHARVAQLAERLAHIQEVDRSRRSLGTPSPAELKGRAPARHAGGSRFESRGGHHHRSVAKSGKAPGC